MSDGWKKHAILGSTYARALGNAAQRAGRDVGALQPALSSIAQQPQAKLRPGMSSFVREPGAMTPTPQQQSVQQLLHKTPWATDEHTGLRGGSEHAVNTYNDLLHSSGQSFNTPAGQPTTHQNIQRTFGAAKPPANEVTQAKPLPSNAYRLPGGFSSPIGHNPFELMDDTGRGSTKIGPAPMPAQRRPIIHTPSSTAGTAVLSKAGSEIPSAATAPIAKGLSRFLPHAVGIGAPLALGAGMLATKPGIQSNVKNLFAGKGSTEEQDKNNELPEAALGQADAIHQALLAHGLDPKTMRIGIDAPPGSGKTTLARALAQRTGMTHYGLDWEPGNAWKSTIGLGRNVEKMPHAPRAGEIMEHYLLNRTHDPELFDAQIHLKRDPEVIRKQLIHRGNASYISDTMDLDKSLGVADLGFDTLGGETIDLGNGTLMKLRPHEGWGNNLDKQLAMKGISPEGLSRHEKLLSLHGGKRTTGAGWTPYIKNPFSTGQTLALGASVPLGIMAARALSKHGYDANEKDAGVFDALGRLGAGIKNQTQNLSMHVGNAMAHADPHAMLNPTLPVPGVGAATSGVINYLGSKIPGRAGNLAAQGIDAALPSINPQGFGARKLISHAVNHFAPGLGPAASAATLGIVHGVPAAVKRFMPAAAPYAGTLLKETL